VSEDIKSKIFCFNTQYKTDGCAETGQPDKNDWIITCEEQNEIYPLVIETIEYVRWLMGE